MLSVTSSLFSMFGRDGESLQDVLRRELAAFQGQNGWIPTQRWDSKSTRHPLWLNVAKPFKTSQTCKSCSLELSYCSHTDHHFHTHNANASFKGYKKYVLQVSSVQTLCNADFPKSRPSILYTRQSRMFSFPLKSHFASGWIITALVLSVLIWFDWSWLRTVAWSFIHILSLSTSCHSMYSLFSHRRKNPVRPEVNVSYRWQWEDADAVKEKFCFVHFSGDKDL